MNTAILYSYFPSIFYSNFIDAIKQFGVENIDFYAKNNTFACSNSTYNQLPTLIMRLKEDKTDNMKEIPIPKEFYI